MTRSLRFFIPLDRDFQMLTWNDEVWRRRDTQGAAARAMFPFLENYKVVREEREDVPRANGLVEVDEW
ncbi:unnamed protein product [Clonostachys rosea]|uniref:Uncharacterized protein n=1 Tax=Bionectria ochroleuca TaxID=29856 RepID=A0ABY6TWF3_BIOOC|nr:unnamed protein product [Clonostachys rosea]